MERRREAILGLKLIAAQAEKLASDLENNRLWEGDYQSAINNIMAAMRNLPEDRGRW